MGQLKGPQSVCQQDVVLCWDFMTALCYILPIHSVPIGLVILLQIFWLHDIQLKI